MKLNNSACRIQQPTVLTTSFSLVDMKTVDCSAKIYVLKVTECHEICSASLFCLFPSVYIFIHVFSVLREAQEARMNNAVYLDENN